jgi:hypothetical protein
MQPFVDGPLSRSYTKTMKPVFRDRRNHGGTVREVLEGRWHLEIPDGPAGMYRWAQLDDYMDLPRAKFKWRAPLRLELRARVSANNLPGTWGFGLWNDPFSASLGIGGAGVRLPALPNTAWFFYAGESNYLAFRDDHPAEGFLAATFASPRVPSPLMAPVGLATPLLAIRPLARLARKMARGAIRESGVLVHGDPTAWQSYRLDWIAERVVFWQDGQEIFTTPVAPRGPMGLVIWIDNQFAAFPPSGKLRMGTSANPAPAWLEIEAVEVTPL